MISPRSEKRRKRINYGIAFAVLLVIEVLIALFVHDSLIRPYVGDALIVVVLYCAVRITKPDKWKALPLYIFLFAATVECLQYFRIVEVLGLEENKFFRILIGSTFDMKDIMCYGIGCIILAVYEWRCKRN